VNARVRRLRLHAAVLSMVVVVLTAGAGVCVLIDAWMAARVVDAAGLVVVAVAIVALERLRRAREQERLEHHRREQRRAELRTLAAPDAGYGQCPVCALGDLDALAADDRATGAIGSCRRVVDYGQRRAHQECAGLVPLRESSAPPAVPAFTGMTMRQLSQALAAVFCAPSAQLAIVERPGDGER
jgi:hypothetical protein